MTGAEENSVSIDRVRDWWKSIAHLCIGALVAGATMWGGHMIWVVRDTATTAQLESLRIQLNAAIQTDSPWLKDKAGVQANMEALRMGLDRLDAILARMDGKIDRIEDLVRSGQ